MLPHVLRIGRSFLAVTCMASLAACGEGVGAGGRGAAGGAGAAVVPATGAELYQQRCVVCHLATGQGIPGSYTPLAGSELATAANPAAAIRIVLLGMMGPLTVNGQQYNAMMPAYGTANPMTDDEVATVLTFVRSSWGNTAGAVTAAEVARERAAVAGRTKAITAPELEALR